MHRWVVRYFFVMILLENVFDDSGVPVVAISGLLAVENNHAGPDPEIIKITIYGISASFRDCCGEKIHILTKSSLHVIVFLEWTKPENLHLWTLQLLLNKCEDHENLP